MNESVSRHEVIERVIAKLYAGFFFIYLTQIFSIQFMFAFIRKLIICSTFSFCNFKLRKFKKIYHNHILHHV